MAVSIEQSGGIMTLRILGVAILLALAANAVLLYQQNVESADSAESAGSPATKEGVSGAPAGQVAVGPAQSTVDAGGYVKAARVGRILGHMAGLRLQVDEMMAIRGEAPAFLSDMGVLYPQVNSPEPVGQVRMLSGGSLAASLAGETNQWVVMRRRELDSYPHREWQCQVNFEVRHLPGQCERADFTISPVQAGFDCERASSEIEQFICQRDRLMQADLEMNQAWRMLRQRAPNAMSRVEQQAWLSSRKNRCPAGSSKRTECLDEMIRARTAQLKRLATQ